MTGGQGSMSKLKAGQVAVWATRTLMDLVGPYAQSAECPLEKWFRDAKIYELFEGTAEIQRLVISRMQVAEYARAPARGGRDRRASRPAAASAAAAETDGARRLRPSAQAATDQPATAAPRASNLAARWLTPTRTPTAGAAVDLRRAGNRRRMRAALAINVGHARRRRSRAASLFDSLALLADAGHVLSDVGAIVLGLVAAGLARARRRVAADLRLSPRRGAGGARQRRRPRGARRLSSSSPRSGGSPTRPRSTARGVLVVGMIGLAGNAWATSVLARGERADINLEAVLRHSAADALGSIAVVVSALAVLAFGWREADPIASLAIAALILASSVRLMREPLDVLMESAPAGVDVDELGAALCAVDGVSAVHELHVWTVTSGFEALAAHVVTARSRPRPRPPRARVPAPRAFRDRAHDAADGGGRRRGRAPAS